MDGGFIEHWLLSPDSESGLVIESVAGTQVLGLAFGVETDFK